IFLFLALLPPLFSVPGRDGLSTAVSSLVGVILLGAGVVLWVRLIETQLIAVAAAAPSSAASPSPTAAATQARPTASVAVSVSPSASASSSTSAAATPAAVASPTSAPTAAPTPIPQPTATLAPVAAVAFQPDNTTQHDLTVAVESFERGSMIY